MKASLILEDGLRVKRAIVEQARSELGEKLKVLEKDEHATRPPRPCGMTVHPAYGCTLGCVYCYVVPDSKKGLVINKLSGPELTVALAINPYFLPGEWGTLVAFGSVTECFLNAETTSKTIEYMHWVKRKLGNPQQISTKVAIERATAEEIARRGDQNLSYLISLTTLSLYRQLEPGAPSPYERLASARQLIYLGIRPAAFIRPVLPGIVDAEYEDILSELASFGIHEVVLGSLMINEWIYNKLKISGMTKLTLEINRRAPSISGGRLIPIHSRDLKQRIRNSAISRGLTVYPSSCAANVASHKQSCNMCKFGPCGEPSGLPKIDDAKELFDILGIYVKEAWVSDDEVLHVKLKRRMSKAEEHLIKAASRRQLHFES